MILGKALVFDIVGELAHFRTFYTNSSSISYGFPARTVIIGMIASILGYERDSYYEKLSPSNFKISVSILTPIKKYIQSVNYVRTKPDEDNFNTFANAVQSYLEGEINTYPVSVEFIVPENDLIGYRVYLSCKKSRSEETYKIYEELKKSLKIGKSYYPIYFGISELLADIEPVGNVEFDISKPIQDKGVKSVIPQDLFEEIEFKESFSLAVEKMPLHFKLENGFRKIAAVKKFFYEKNGKEIPFKKLEKVVSINGENIVWME